jgi:transcriptional regulator with XRE-family HTH domain
MKKSDNLSRKYTYDEEGLRLISERLKEIRKEKGISQEELAYRSELTLSQIARIETLKTNPTISTLFKIIRTLEIKPSDLFNFDLLDNNKDLNQK